ncbi:pre-mRNA-splicing factor CWC22 homolog [Acanthaster planci]|uniref:Pre-mRNA-splicing factor CWC22 homolog n=1 Tax=Acanthaster planci TaxID=133434 RepID=A0A8B7XGA6_ACAPL|nr:pre-mRNA-splicing factor CWC22 homolog [Acanthaster planci]
MMCLLAIDRHVIDQLVNRQVAHEVIALEILTLLLENPINNNGEVAIGFLKESAMKLSEVSPRGVNAIFDRLRSILHEAQVEQGVQYMVEVMSANSKDGFKDFPAVQEGLHLVEESEQCTHLLTLEENYSPEENTQRTPIVLPMTKSTMPSRRRSQERIVTSQAQGVTAKNLTDRTKMRKMKNDEDRTALMLSPLA